jgi:chromosome segregation ATPase
LTKPYVRGDNTITWEGTDLDFHFENLIDAHTKRLDAIEERLTRLDGGDTTSGRNAPDAEPERCGCEQACELERELERVREAARKREHELRARLMDFDEDKFLLDRKLNKALCDLRDAKLELAAAKKREDELIERLEEGRDSEAIMKHLRANLEECRGLLKQALTEKADLRVSLREAKLELAAAKDQAEGFRRQTESQRVGELQRALEDSREEAAKYKLNADTAERELARFRDVVRAAVICEPLF